jgi:biotin carboxylase
LRKRDIVVAIDTADGHVVNAVQAVSKNIGYPLKGVLLRDKNDSTAYWEFSRDKSGFFKDVWVDYNDDDSLQAALKGYAERTLVVITQSENSIEHFKKVIPFLPYTSAPTETSLTWAREKKAMRQRLRTYDEKLVPKYTCLYQKDLANIDDIIRGLTFPVIIKPSGLSAQMLIEECKSKDELVKKLKHAFGLIQKLYDQELTKSEPVILIEEMMQGDMYTTDAYVSHDGVVYCLPLIKVISAHSMGLPGFYAYRDIAPVEDLSQPEIKAAFAAARAAVKALNLRSTTTHIEMFKTKDGWKIIELAARMGGDRDVEYREVYGIDHSYNDVAIRAGLKPRLPRKAMKAIITDLIFANEEGIIESIDGIEEVRKLPSTTFVGVHGKPGAKALFSANGGEYLVDVVLANKDRRQLETDAVKMRELVRIKIKQKLA